LSDPYSSNTFNFNKKGSLARAILGYYNCFMGKLTVADIEAQHNDEDHNKDVIFITYKYYLNLSSCNPARASWLVD